MAQYLRRPLVSIVIRMVWDWNCLQLLMTPDRIRIRLRSFDERYPGPATP
jgi:hypothetical protein